MTINTNRQNASSSLKKSKPEEIGNHTPKRCSFINKGLLSKEEYFYCGFLTRREVYQYRILHCRFYSQQLINFYTDDYTAIETFLLLLVEFMSCKKRIVLYTVCKKIYYQRNKLQNIVWFSINWITSTITQRTSKQITNRFVLQYSTAVLYFMTIVYNAFHLITWKRISKYRNNPQ